MGLGGVLLAVIMYYFESLGISKFLVDKIPALVVNNYNTASTLLSTFSAGVLSILVFSFSMVMLLLNQAGNNFSPRVLPGLISVKRHQYIIGLFLGTILFCAIVLIGLQPSSNKYHLPGFSVLLGMLLTLVCLFSFIYFIDSISKSIQVQNILSNIFDKAAARLKKLREIAAQTSSGLKEESGYTIVSDKTGYIQTFNEELLSHCVQKNNMFAELIPIEGSFVMKGEPILKCSKQPDAETTKEILSALIINRSGEDVSQNYLLGFKQIAEIGIRAMSPGINDPATAITTLDYLSELFSYQMYLPDGYRYLMDKENAFRVAVPMVSFENLLYEIMAEYRTYCKADIVCMQKMILMLQHLSRLPQAKESHKIALLQELKLIGEDTANSIQNSTDLQRMKMLLEMSE